MKTTWSCKLQPIKLFVYEFLKYVYSCLYYFLLLAHPLPISITPPFHLPIILKLIFIFFSCLPLIFLHLLFHFWDLFCPLTYSSLLYLHFITFLSSLSCSALSMSLGWSVQQGQVTFLGCLLHMVHIPASLPRGPPLLTAGSAETSPKLSVLRHCSSLK